MRRFHFSRAAAALFTILAVGTFCFGFEIAIDVSPQTLNLQSEGVVVTVHTDIAYGAVDVHSVYLNGIHIHSWKADNQGNFVAKFSMDEVKTLDGLVIGDYNELQLVGATNEGEAFSGEAEIMVIDIEPEGKGKEK
jgi:hypothetical protein